MSTYVAAIVTPSDTYYLPFHDSHGWRLIPGFASPRQRWVVPKEIAAAVMADLAGLSGLAAECSLLIGEAAAPTEIARVVVLGSEPADNEQRRTLVFADVRYYFELEVFAFDANVRRRVGDRRLVGNTSTAETPVDTVAYAPWSVSSLGPFTWIELALQVTEYAGDARHGRPAVAFAFDTFSLVSLDAQLVQETTSDGDGCVGLKRGVESLPGAGVYVDLDGDCHVFERTFGAEASAIAALHAPLWDHGDLQTVDESRRRPATWYRVYFDFEIAVRLDYDATATWGAHDPFLEPVLQVTENSLAIPMGSWGAARTVAQGTWITLAEAFAAWGAGPGGQAQLTDAIVCTHWFDGGLDSYMRTALGALDPTWAARIEELKRTFRTFFRANPHFWDRIRHAWAVRPEIWDPATGTRAPAPVYANYSLQPISPLTNVADLHSTKNVTNSYHTSGLLANGKPSGFLVNIVDEEIGVLEILRPLTKFPGHARVNVSDVVAEAALTNDNVLPQLVSDQALAPDTSWKLAVVLSVAPGAPNDLRRFYEYILSPADAAVSVGLPSYLAAGQGPDVELRCQMSDCRIMWRDADRANILAILGTGDTTGDIRTLEPVAITAAIVNQLQELRPAALAVAAADLLAKLDHVEGTRAVQFDPSIVPIGSIAEVEHRVMADKLVTVIHCTGSPPEFNAADFLHGSARSFLLKELAQGGR